MRFVIAGCLSVAIAAAVSAQQPPQQPPPQQQPPRPPDPVPPATLERPSTTSGDPRIGLKAGIHDAGEAAKNLERIASLGKLGWVSRPQGEQVDDFKAAIMPPRAKAHA